MVTAVDEGRIQRVFEKELERGCDNQLVVGGFDRMLIQMSEDGVLAANPALAARVNGCRVPGTSRSMWRRGAPGSRGRWLHCVPGSGRRRLPSRRHSRGGRGLRRRTSVGVVALTLLHVSGRRRWSRRRALRA